MLATPLNGPEEGDVKHAQNKGGKKRRKKRMRSVRLFGKSIPLLAIVAIAMSAGMVGAALLSYYGIITGTVNVQQSVLVDGGDYLQINTYGGGTVAGNTIRDGPHTLLNQADVPVDVTFETAQSGDGTPDNNVVGITTTYSTEITDNSTDFGSRNNEVVAIVPELGLTLNALFAGDGLRYRYTIIDGGLWAGASPIIAVIDLQDGRHIALYPGWGGRTGTHTLQFSETVATCDADSGAVPVDFALYPGDFSQWLYGSVSCGYGNFADVKADTGLINGSEVVTRIAIQHQAANTGETDQLVWLAFDSVICQVQIEEGVPFTLQSGELLNFYIVNEFDAALVSGTYTITTKVVPA